MTTLMNSITHSRKLGSATHAEEQNEKNIINGIFRRVEYGTVRNFYFWAVNKLSCEVEPPVKDLTMRYKRAVVMRNIVI